MWELHSALPPLVDVTARVDAGIKNKQYTPAMAAQSVVSLFSGHRKIIIFRSIPRDLLDEVQPVNRAGAAHVRIQIATDRRTDVVSTQMRLRILTHRLYT